ncbi:MAG: MipA/OmpV family protein [Woeseiaceae bacterium]|nr:MipA/OmpV family protein [Woeseiaceae bacterium]
MTLTSRLTLFAAALLATLAADAATIELRLADAPSEGTLIVQVYDAPDAFGDLRDPAKEYVLSAAGEGPYRLNDVPNGDVAILAYYDVNANGRIDKNFIGIPKEPLAISNNYQPKGPPSFVRASVNLAPGSEVTLNMGMDRVLGERGLVGLGIGMIGRGSPYVDSTENVTRVIPAVTYVGERLQWFGPALRYGIAGSGKLRLAAAAEYRIGAYEESDSPVLAGLGDREGLLMAGLSLQYEISEGFELEALYQHDALDRVGGGMGNIRLSRGFPLGPATLVPQVAYNWLSSDLSNHDFGVAAAAATTDRPAYDLGNTTSIEAGLGLFVELGDNWRIIANIAAEQLDDDVTRSPIVDDDVVVKGLAIITYVF